MNHEQSYESDETSAHNRRQNLRYIAGATAFAGAIAALNHFGAFDHSIETDTPIGSDPARATEASTPRDGEVVFNPDTNTVNVPEK